MASHGLKIYSFRSAGLKNFLQKLTDMSKLLSKMISLSLDQLWDEILVAESKYASRAFVLTEEYVNTGDKSLKKTRFFFPKVGQFSNLNNS